MVSTNTRARKNYLKAVKAILLARKNFVKKAIVLTSHESEFDL